MAELPPSHRSFNKAVFSALVKLVKFGFFAVCVSRSRHNSTMPFDLIVSFFPKLVSH
jgi:hypothetical protein